MKTMLDWKTMPNGHAKRHAYMASREWAYVLRTTGPRGGKVWELVEIATGNVLDSLNNGKSPPTTWASIRVYNHKHMPKD